MAVSTRFAVWSMRPRQWRCMAALVGGGRRPAAGYLASLRDVTCSVDRLDLLEGDLLVTAELLIADAGRVIYRFD